jgi:hypothetical protein
VSLIDEALKRAELEAARRDGLRRGTYPWVHEHMPAKRRRRAAVGVAAIALAVVGGGAWWLAARGHGQAPGTRNPKAPDSTSRPKDSALETVEVAAPPAGIALRPPSAGKPQPKPAVASNAPVPPSKEEGRPKPSPQDTRSAGPDEPRPARAAESKRSGGGSAEGKTYAGEFSAPDGVRITLDGIVYSDTNPVALINGKVLPPGAVVEDFTIVAIQPDRIEMRGRGTTIFLTLK